MRSGLQISALMMGYDKLEIPLLGFFGNVFGFLEGLLLGEGEIGNPVKCHRHRRPTGLHAAENHTESGWNHLAVQIQPLCNQLDHLRSRR